MQHASVVERLLVAVAHGIVKGRWLPDEPLPSVRRLAKELGVSVPTVIKVIHAAAAAGLVALRSHHPARVLPTARQAAEELLTRHHADNSGRTRIALLYPANDWPMSKQPHVSLHQHLDLHARKTDLEFDLIAWPLKSQATFALSLPARGYAGAVCLGVGDSYQAGLVALVNQRFPAIAINRDFRGLGLPCISFDDYKPAGDLARRLAAMGHRNMSLVSDVLPMTNNRSHDALRGWVDGLVECGLLDQCSMPICMLPNLQQLRETPRTFDLILGRPDRPTALFFYWPVWADVILTDPRFAAFRVPEDISLILALPGERSLVLPNVPPLTTLDFDYDRMAENVVRTMINLTNGKPCAEMLLLPLNLNLTESVGPPPKS